MLNHQILLQELQWIYQLFGTLLEGWTSFFQPIALFDVFMMLFMTQFVMLRTVSKSTDFSVFVVSITFCRLFY